jgi:hypothetical protein
VILVAFVAMLLGLVMQQIQIARLHRQMTAVRQSESAARWQAEVTAALVSGERDFLKAERDDLIRQLRARVRELRAAEATKAAAQANGGK